MTAEEIKRKKSAVESKIAVLEEKIKESEQKVKSIMDALVSMGYNRDDLEDPEYLSKEISRLEKEISDMEAEIKEKWGMDDL